MYLSFEHSYSKYVLQGIMIINNACLFNYLPLITGEWKDHLTLLDRQILFKFLVVGPKYPQKYKNVTVFFLSSSLENLLKFRHYRKLQALNPYGFHIQSSTSNNPTSSFVLAGIPTPFLGVLDRGKPFYAIPFPFLNLKPLFQF